MKNAGAAASGMTSIRSAGMSRARMASSATVRVGTITIVARWTAR